MPKKSSAFADAFKFGLGAGFGAAISSMVLILIGIGFFLPGIYLLSQERKKPKEKQNQTNIIGAYVLMVLGVIFGLGMGASFLFSNLMEDM